MPLTFDFQEDRPGEVAFIGDVHGCYLSHLSMLSKIQQQGAYPIYLGDLNDRGPDSLSVIRSVRELVLRGEAMCVLGNHDKKLLKFLQGSKVTPSHGLAGTIEQLREHMSPEELALTRDWLAMLPVCIRTPSWVAVHAAYEEGLSDGKFRSLCIYGETDGTTNEEGYPTRLYGWRDRYQGTRRLIAHGHDILKANEPRTTKHGDGLTVVNVDTGAWAGYPLTAYCYPSGRLIQVPGHRG